jgi:transglutaminase-like putative cysteine protease
MNAVLERQRWLAALALMVAVPLPLTGIVSWPFLLPFLAMGAWAAISRRSLRSCPAWLENVFAPLILLAVIGAGGIRFGVLRPVAQLAVLVAAVRLPGCGQRSRTVSASAVLALVGVAGIASSTHPTLIIYLVALLAFLVVAVGRLTALSLAEGATAGTGAVTWPPLRLVAGTVTVAIVIAAPLFAVLPRLRSPFAAGPFTARSITGFRDSVMLRGIGDVKQSHRLVMRVTFPGVEPGRVSPDWLRLVGATLKHYRAGGWVEGRLKGERVLGRPDHPVALGEQGAGARIRRAEIVLEVASRTVFAPVGAVSLTPDSTMDVTREPSGALRLARGTEPPLSYQVRFDPARVEQPGPDGADLELPPRSEDLRALAEQISGRTTNPLAAALAIEQYLQDNYRYVLRANAPLREDPVHWFLFQSREGHCEFFASSMVLLLRSLGIPARLQAGYAGAESDGKGGFLVRDSHAHAWVLAYIEREKTGAAVPPGQAEPAPGGAAAHGYEESRKPLPANVGGSAGQMRREGGWSDAGPPRNDGNWRVFDPTPPEGRPGITPMARGRMLAASWERLESLWDRWVLTFSMTDQVELVRRALDTVAVGRRFLALPAVALTGLVAVLLLLRMRWKEPRRRVTATGTPTRITRALQRAMGDAARHGVSVPVAMTPRQFAGLAREAFPGTGEPLAWLVREHERACYAEGVAPSRRDVRSAVRALARAIARAPRALNGTQANQ